MTHPEEPEKGGCERRLCVATPRDWPVVTEEALWEFGGVWTGESELVSWRAGSRRSRRNRRTPRSRQRRRNTEVTRKPQLRQPWSSPVLCAELRCQTQKLSSSILKANTPSLRCLQNL